MKNVFSLINICIFLFILSILFTIFLFSCSKYDSAPSGLPQQTFDARSVLNKILPAAGDVTTATDTLKKRGLIITKGDWGRDYSEALPSWFSAGWTPTTTATNSGWVGFELYRLLVDSTRFDLSPYLPAGTIDFGIENILDNINMTFLILYAWTSLPNNEACTKNIDIRNGLTGTASFSATTSAGRIVVPFNKDNSSSAFPTETYQQKVTISAVSPSGETLTIKVAKAATWNSYGGIWKILINEINSNSNSFTYLSYNPMLNSFSMDRVLRSSNNSFHVRMHITGDFALQEFTLKYLKRNHQADCSTNNCNAIAISISGEANRFATWDLKARMIYIGLVKYLYGNYDSSISNSNVKTALIISPSYYSEGQYQGWFEYAQATSTGGDRTGSDLNQFSTYPRYPIPFEPNTFIQPGLVFRDNITVNNLSTNYHTAFFLLGSYSQNYCLYIQDKCIHYLENVLSAGFYNDSDLPIEHNAATEGNAYWTEEIF
ncbi:MAG: hypothetical protein HQK49_07590 [Oligoflexia bacterium]|nr:hypothetical protein [Oligoflexia bacterium]